MKGVMMMIMMLTVVVVVPAVGRLCVGDAAVAATSTMVQMTGG